jgi:hypothetical protein
VSRVVLLLALAVLAGATRAEAYGPRTEVGVRAALDYWGQAPDCPGGVDHQWRDEMPADWGIQGEAYAASLMPGCVIVFDRKLAGELRDDDLSGYCQLIVHEYGHLLGHDHSDNPDDIMYDGDLDFGFFTHFPACDRAIQSYRSAKRHYMQKRRAHRARRSYVGDLFDSVG